MMDPQLELLGAEPVDEGIMFFFALHGVADGEPFRRPLLLGSWELGQWFQHQDWATREAPRFDLEQLALTDPDAYAKLRRERRAGRGDV